MMEHESIILKNRTINDRSLIYYSESSNDFPLDKISQIIKLSKVQRKTLEILFERRLFASVNNDNTQSLNDLTPLVDTTTVVLTRRLKKLADLGIITPIKFSYADPSAKRGKIKVYHLYPDATLFSNSATSNKSKSKYKKSDSAQRIKSFKSKHQFRDLPVPEDTMIIGFSKFGKDEIIKHDQLVLPDTMVKDSHIFEYNLYEEVENSSKKVAVPVVVQASAPKHSRILNAFDYKVLYALYSLTHAYHNKNIGYYLESHKEIENNTPIHIDHVCHIIGKKSTGGKDHDQVRESFSAIQLTTLQVYSRRKDKDDLYKMTNVRYLKTIEGATTEAPEINDDRVKFKGVYFRVVWNDEDFDRIINHNHFVYPLPVLQSSNTIFLLYLNLRNLSALFRDKPNSRTILFDRLAKFIRITQNSSLKQTLLKAFGVNKNGTLNKSISSVIKTVYIEEKNILKANLWGYYLTLDFDVEAMAVEPNWQEISYHCDLPYTQKAPEMKNPLRLVDLTNNRSLLDEIKRADEAYEFEKAVSAVSFNKSTGYSTKSLNYSVEFKKGPSILTLTRYSSDKDIYEIIDIVSAKAVLPVDSLFAYFKQAIERISFFRVSDVEIPLSVFSYVSDYLKDNFSLEVTESELCLFVNRRRSFHSMLVGVTEGDSLVQHGVSIENLARDYSQYIA